jgi:hypothetical protein
MKTLKNTLLLAALMFLLPAKLPAQDQKYIIHEDRVKPSKAIEYHKLLQELADAASKHNIAFSWATIVKADESILYVSPIANMAELDKNPFAELAEKIGKDKLDEIYNRMDKCYDKHGNYVVTLVKDLSYLPDNSTMTTEGQNYRRYHYYHVKPENSEAMSQKMKAVKSLFESKKSKMNYRIFHSGFGIMGEYYVAVVPAADAEAYEKTMKETQALLGPDMKKVFDELDAVTESYSTEIGYYLPKKSHSPKK